LRRSASSVTCSLTETSGHRRELNSVTVPSGWDFRLQGGVGSTGVSAALPRGRMAQLVMHMRIGGTAARRDLWARTSRGNTEQGPNVNGMPRSSRGATLAGASGKRRDEPDAHPSNQPRCAVASARIGQQSRKGVTSHSTRTLGPRQSNPGSSPEPQRCRLPDDPSASNCSAQALAHGELAGAKQPERAQLLP